MKTKKAAIILVALVLIILAAYLYIKLNSKEKEVNPFQNSKIEVKTFKQEGGLWGYDVLIDDKLYVHQPNIPALPGDNGFKSEEEAKKTGELIIKKIRENILPPTITVEELNELGIK